MNTRLPDGPIVVVLGTRPEIIKLAPIVRLLGPAAMVFHTGQHYDDLLSESFFDGLGLASPAVRLEVGGKARPQQIAIALDGLSAAFVEKTPAAVVVQGDTNTALAAALAANANGIPLVHVEAGLRSFDRRMPEEHNRVIADHLSDLLLAPTAVSEENLAREGIEGERVAITGNTVVEVTRAMMPPSVERSALLDRHGLEAGGYVLSTMHRPENVDVEVTLRTILEELAALPVPVVIPLHPRTVHRARAFGLTDLLDRIQVFEPIGYPEFLALAAESALLISDSGGVQEEVSVYKRPLIVVRRSTERPEVIGTFAERVLPGPAIGDVARQWLDDIDNVHQRLATIPTPYGDGTAAERSVAAIEDLVA